LQQIISEGEAGLKIFDSTKIPLLSKALQAYSMRQKVISSNIANIATPGYRTQHVTFEDELAGAMEGTAITGMQTNERHLQIGSSSNGEVTPEVVDTTGSADQDDLVSGVNNVDIDQEMAELAKNQIRFKFAARMISDTFKGIQKSIRGQL
jgi:flagellar basal-body rod protein FlgB